MSDATLREEEQIVDFRAQYQMSRIQTDVQHGHLVESPVMLDERYDLLGRYKRALPFIIGVLYITPLDYQLWECSPGITSSLVIGSIS